MNSKNIIKVLSIIVACIVCLALLWPFTVVQAGHTGVRVTLGSVDSIALSEGLHMRIPFSQSIKQVDNRIQKLEAESASASKDLQTIHSKIAVNYRVNQTSSATLYKNVGVDYSNIIISPAIQEVVKAITAKHTAEELITKRQSASIEMKDFLAEKVKTYGIIVDNFNIVNFEFSEEFNKAIESKQTAQQLALKAEQDLARVKIEAEQQITKAKAEAESLKAQKLEITPELLQLRQIEVMKEKWDGKMPTTVYIGNGNESTTLFGIPIK
jgi:Membrane protease subunits, stomatin/prohibitin homologs